MVDDTAFRARFGARATAVDEGAKATVDWAREHYKEKARPFRTARAVCRLSPTLALSWAPS
jgi:hypothetical protein